MKPFAFPLLLLAALLIGGIVSSSWVRWVQEPITDGLEQAAEAGALENWSRRRPFAMPPGSGGKPIATLWLP